MNERRASRRQKSFLRGVVYFDKRRSETACLVRDLSEDGARIVLSQTITIPDVIELQIPQRQQTLSARVQHPPDAIDALIFFYSLIPRPPAGKSAHRRIAELEAEIPRPARTICKLHRLASNGDVGIEAI